MIGSKNLAPASLTPEQPQQIAVTVRLLSSAGVSVARRQAFIVSRAADLAPADLDF